MARKMNLLGLAKSAAQLRRVPSQIARPVADQVNALIQAGFDAGRDPYGHGWEPLAEATLAKGRFPPPLTDTRKMRAQAITIPMGGSGLQLAPQVSYGQHHMSGTPDMPKRRYWPDAGLPSAWRQIIREEMHRQTQENLNG